MDRSVIQNYPFRTNFAGLKGDLRSMQSNGWEMAVDTAKQEAFDTLRIRVAGRHRGLNLVLMSGYAELSPREWMLSSGLSQYLSNIEIPIKVCAQTVVISLHEAPQFRSANFKSQMIVEMGPPKQFSLEDFCVFKTFGNETEIYVPEKKIFDVQEYLKDILDSQKDKQSEIRQQMLRDGEKYKFNNQIQESQKLRLVGYTA